MTHIINGMAGNIESHSVLDAGEKVANITAVLDQSHYGFSKLTVLNATALKWTFVRGDGADGDELMLYKRSNGTSSSSLSKRFASKRLASGATRVETASLGFVVLACLVAFLH
jgi:hypothetical protein